MISPSVDPNEILEDYPHCLQGIGCPVLTQLIMHSRPYL